MEALIRNDSTFQRHYNCSFYLIEEIPLKERSQNVVSLLYLISFCGFFILYSVCIYTMATTELRKRPCYKIMIELGVFHLVGLILGGLAPALLSMDGAMFCSFPTLIYFIGSCAFSCWCATTMTSLILGLNRCLELYDPLLADFLFARRRMWLWLATPLLYVAPIWLFARPGIFNSQYFGFFYNPHHGYWPDVENVYTSKVQIVNNVGLAAVETIIYIVMIRKYRNMLKKEREAVKAATGGISEETRGRKSNLEKRIYAQVALIGAVHLFSNVSYVGIQFFPLTFASVFTATTVYYVSQGVPSLIYITINRTLRTAMVGKMCAVKLAPASQMSQRSDVPTRF